jgi:hypothetical protein
MKYITRDLYPVRDFMVFLRHIYISRNNYPPSIKPSSQGPEQSATSPPQFRTPGKRGLTELIWRPPNAAEKITSQAGDVRCDPTSK